MTILVTGSTGTIGSQVVANLAEQGAEVHALTRSPEKAKFPRGVTPAQGDLLDIDATQAALAKASTLFLLNAVTPDEVTQALLMLSLAQEAGVKRIVYCSVFHSETARALEPCGWARLVHTTTRFNQGAWVMTRAAGVRV